MRPPFPIEIWRIGPWSITDTLLTSLILSIGLWVGLRMLMHTRRHASELIYETLERSITEASSAHVAPLVPLILTQWLFIGAANLIGLVPYVKSPTQDLAVPSALAAVSLFSGHLLAFRKHGIRYLVHYVRPTPFLLPLNIIGELSRTLALALRLFGNMLSGTLVLAIMVYIAGLLIPVPLMLLSVLTSVVQAYIFGVLTLVFAASSLETAEETREISVTSKQEKG